MSISRREFVVLASAITCGCGSSNRDQGGDVAPLIARDVDAGPAADVSARGTSDALAANGFFLIRQDDGFVAISSVCTHRSCRVKPLADRSFRCGCHGSTFDPAGRVTRGPASRDLPHYATSLDERGHLIVHVRPTPPPDEA